MTVTSNIFVGIGAWSSSTSYPMLGTRVSNNGNAYQLVLTGTSGSGGPAGTGANITDNTCVWRYVAAINFTNFASFAASIPATLTQPIIGTVYNTGPLTTTVGVPYLTLSGHTTSAANTITLVSPVIDSFRTTLTNQITPLNFNTANGVGFTLPNAANSSPIAYLTINDSNVIVDGLQFQDPNAASNCSIVGGTGSNITIRNCIFDGYGQTNGVGANIIQLSNSAHIYNCLIVDREGTGQSVTVSNVASTSTVTNCTFVSTVTNTAGTPIGTNSGSTLTIRNTALFGYMTLASGVYQVFDHCCTDATTISPGKNNGSNLVSKIITNQFVSASTDFRLVSTADCVNAGIADPTDVPAANDIAGTPRPQLGTWDISAWEYKVPYFSTLNIVFFKIKSVAYVQARNLIPQAIALDPAGGTDPFSSPFSSDFGGGSRLLLATDPSASLGVAGITEIYAGLSALTLEWTAPNPLANTLLYVDGPAIHSFYPIVISFFNLQTVSGSTQAFDATGRPSFLSLTARASVHSTSGFTSRNTILALNTRSATLGNSFAESNFSAISNLSQTASTTTSIALKWLPSAATYSFFAIRTAGTLFLGNGINGRNYLFSLKAVVTATKSNVATAVNSLFVLRTQATSLINFQASATLTVLPLTPVVTSGFALSCITQDNVMTLSSVSLAATFGINAVNSLPFSAIGAAETFGISADNNIDIIAAGLVYPTHGFTGLSNVLVMQSVVVTAESFFAGQSNIDLTCVVNVVTNWFFTAISTIEIDFFSHLTQSELASGTGTIEMISGHFKATQANLLQSLNTIPFSIFASISDPCHGRSQIWQVSALGQATPFNVAAASIDTVMRLSVHVPSLQAIQAEDGTNLATDSNKFLLLADASYINMTQSDPVSGLGTFNYLAQSAVGKQLTAQGIEQITYVAKANVGQIDQASARVNLPLIEGTSIIGYGMSGIVSILNLNSQPAFNLFITTDPFKLQLLADGSRLALQIDSARIPQLTQQDLAQTINNINLVVAATALQSHVGFITETILSLSTVAQAVQQNVAQAIDTINIGFTGAINQFRPASLVANIDIRFRGISFSTFRATGRASIDIVPVIALAQSHTATATATVFALSSVTAGGVGYTLSGVNSLMSFSTTQSEITQLQAAVGVSTALALQTQSVAQGVANITAAIAFPINVLATAAQYNNAITSDEFFVIDLSVSTGIVLTTPTQAANNIDITAVANININASDMYGLATITLIDPSVINTTQRGISYTTVNINFVASANMWQTPSDFVEGDSIVWWAR